MLLLNQWRMPLIFTVSAIPLALVAPEITGRVLLQTRFVRIFIPLIIGTCLVVPPQLYCELMQKEGFSGDYFSFFGFYINTSSPMYPGDQHRPTDLLTWDH